MLRIKTTLVFVIALGISAYAAIHSMNWKVKDDYSIKFTGKKVSGTFRGMSSSLMFNEEHPEKAKFSAVIDTKTINTGNGVMNKQAVASDALNVAEYPTITFESSSVRKTGIGFETTGDLTIKGMTKTVTIPFTFEKIAEEAVFKGRFSLNPKEYHVNRLGVTDKREMPDKIDVELVIPVK